MQSGRGVCCAMAHIVSSILCHEVFAADLTSFDIFDQVVLFNLSV